MKTDTKDFLESVKRLADIHNKRCETDPVLRAHRDADRKRNECSSTHKKYHQDYDIHGPLEEWCERCGVWRGHYSIDQNNKESFMTCDQILERKS